MLKSIKVNGYRLLNEFEADLGQLTVVVGANASGKSTVLDCLQLVSDLASRPTSDAISWHGGMFSILSAIRELDQFDLEVTFDSSGTSKIWNEIPTKDILNYQLSLKMDPSGQPLPVNELLKSVKKNSTVSKETRFLVSNPDGSMILDKRSNQMVPFDQAVSSNQTPSTDSDGKTPVSQPGLRISQMRFFNDYPIPSRVRTALAFISVYPGFNVGRLSDLRIKTPEITPTVLLWDNGSNLGTVLHEIFTRYEYRKSAQDIREFLRLAYPSFEDVTAETGYGGGPARAIVQVHEKGLRRPMWLSDLSDGMIRFLCLATALLNPGWQSIICIDEPEAGFHPRLYPIIADMIKVASEKTQILIATHSPDLLNRFDLDDVAVMARDDNKSQWKRPGNRKSLRKMLENVVGDSLGDLHRSGELEAIES